MASISGYSNLNQAKPYEIFIKNAMISSTPQYNKSKEVVPRTARKTMVQPFSSMSTGYPVAQKSQQILRRHEKTTDKKRDRTLEKMFKVKKQPKISHGHQSSVNKSSDFTSINHPFLSTKASA